MHITTLAKLILTGALAVSAPLSAAEVFTWKNHSGTNTYSDVPRNLKPAQSGRVNVRTRSVTPAVPTQPAVAENQSLADQQKQLSEEIARQNKQVEAQNQKIEAENRRQQEANCQTARINRQFAESARVNNRADLIARYDADIAKFCN
ncbi:DUF4124 domain-containing protein [Uruburuella testudinis]|uniref:DUF4124 domain-containing protein n=1 Tax=Uruburuella testudinis TaxID=1282863 RepID=A0ABY4DS35_9NEIS|nr:DUF4124 domain-containing protein [Uruburuella testudinis]UOO81223.1 DUF4124 domain-containing protein [Uruburuella testudinis]